MAKKTNKTINTENAEWREDDELLEYDTDIATGIMEMINN